MPDDDDRMLELIYEESVRGLEAQERELESVDLRASFVLAGAGVAAAALGQSGRHGAFAVLALLSFLVSAGLAVLTFLPRFGNWQFQHNVNKMVSTFVGTNRTYAGSQGWIIKDNRAAYENNQKRLNTLYKFLFFASLMLALGISLVVLDLGLD